MGKWLIKVAITESHPLLREGLKTLLERTDYIKVIHSAPNGKQLIEDIPGLPSPPDVVILAAGIPVVDDCAIAVRLKKLYPRIKILALSFYDDEYNIIKMIKAGAGGYLLKATTTSAEVVKAVENVYLNGYHLSDAYGKDEKIAMRSMVEPLISDVEIQILKLCADGLTNRQIADIIGLNFRSVEYHCKNLLAKLKAKNRINMVIKAWRYGFLK